MSVAIHRRKGSLGRITFGLLWIVVFSVPFNDIVVIPGFGTITRLLGYVALGSAIVAVGAAGKVHRLQGSAAWAFAFAAWAALSVSWSMWEQTTLDRIPTVIRALGLFWLIYQFTDTSTRFRGILLAMLLGNCVCIGGILSALRAGRFVVDAGYSRYMFETLDPNDLAVMVALGIPMAWYLQSVSPRRLVAWGSRFYIPLAVVTIVLTGSRGGLLTTVVALLIVARNLLRLRPGTVVAVSVGLGLAVIGVFYFVPESVLLRFLTIHGELVGGTISYRRTIWTAGFELLGRHPLLGVGIGAFPEEVCTLGGFPEAPVAHSTLLGILFELGSVGLLLFLAILAATFAATRRLPTEERWLCRVLLATWLIGTASLSWELQKATWVLLGWIAAAGVRGAVFGGGDRAGGRSRRTMAPASTGGRDSVRWEGT